MGTLVCLHAHPDDEAIATGGAMARAHAEGHRVVLVVATDGAHGELPDDLAPGESLADRRRGETLASAAALGIDRVEFLGYADSGMTGWEQNANPGAFMQADVDEAGQRVAALLVAERADVVTIYDWHGGYGHPDHIQVHRVGVRAAEIARAERPHLRVFEATMNRDEMSRFVEQAVASGVEAAQLDFDPNGPMDDGNPMGTPEAEITTMVDVADYVVNKRAAIRAHRSQVTDAGFFSSMPDEQFALAFGHEWYIEHGVEPGPHPGWFFD